MIVWEVRDTNGALLTTCFTERDAAKFRDRFEAKHSGQQGLKIAKVFNAEEREKEPVKPRKRKKPAPDQMATVDKAISHVDETPETPEVPEASAGASPKMPQFGPIASFFDGINDAVNYVRQLMVDLDPDWDKIKRIEIVKKYQYTGNKPDAGWVVMVRR